MLQGNYNNFLLELNKIKDKIIYAKITALTFTEFPIETIEGRITQGSINLDSNSAIRRSCSLTMLAQNYNTSNYEWGLNTKFKLEIGIENKINNNFPDIIWIPQGIFLLTSFNISNNINNFTINLSGKDKMCLLNGENGGILESTIDFGSIEEEDKNGVWSIRKLPIQDIIKNLLHTYGGEPYHNILINDLNNFGLELLEYRYDKPLYLYRSPESDIYVNALLENDCTNLYYDNNQIVKLKDLDINHLEILTETLYNNSNIASPVYSDSKKQKKWYFTKIENGQTAGYKTTDLTYAGDLIANAGESITSILDKIKNMLVEFEYFYDVYGHFVFQKKQSFISTMWSPSLDNNLNNFFVNENLSSFFHTYSFANNELITTLNNTPNLSNVKNDYTIWGERESVSGAVIPIHLRYAIDLKPLQYTQILVTEEEADIYNKKYNTLLTGRSIAKTYISSNEQYHIDENIIYCDWREVLYQMALDYFKYNYLDNFELKVSQANPSLYYNGQTGYEQYYTDIQGFWRQLFYPEINQDYNQITSEKNSLNNLIINLNNLIYGSVNEYNGIKIPGLIDKISRLNNLILLYEAVLNSSNRLNAINGANNLLQWLSNQNINLVYKDSENMSIPIYAADNIDGAKLILQAAQQLYKQKLDELTIFKSNLEILITKEQEILEKKDKFYSQLDFLNEEDWLIEKNKGNFENYNSYKEYCYRLHWNKDVYENPEGLNFWFDFLDVEGELSQFNVKVIGSRPKVINDSSIKSIYFRETPSVIFQEPGEEYMNLGAYRSIQIPDIETMFSISAQGKNAKERLDELLYQHSYCIENISITAIPIYHLQLNSRIYINDKKSGLSGDYIVNKITLPLNYNGTMSITATKAAKNIL